jgi:hypothetical protein
VSLSDLFPSIIAVLASWDKWDRVDPKDIEKIASLFFQRVCQLEKVSLPPFSA